MTRSNNQKDIYNQLRTEAIDFFKALERPKTSYVGWFLDELLDEIQRSVAEGFDMVQALQVLYGTRHYFDHWQCLKHCSQIFLEQNRPLPQPIRLFLIEQLSNNRAEPKKPNTKAKTQRRKSLALAVVILENRGLNATRGEDKETLTVCKAVADAWREVFGDSDVTYLSVAKAYSDLGNDMREQLSQNETRPVSALGLSKFDKKKG